MYEYYEDPDPSYWQYYVLLLVVSIIVTCLLLNTIANLAQRVSHDLRTLSTGQIWVTVIPVFGSFWIFYVVNQLSSMLREEFARRKIVEFEMSPGLSSGLGFCFTLFIAQLSLSLDAVAFSVVMYIVAIALLAVYWSKLAGFTKKLDQGLYQSAVDQSYGQQSFSQQSFSQQSFSQQPYQSSADPLQQQWPSTPQFPPPQFPPPPSPHEPPTQWQYPPQEPPPQSPPPDEWDRWRPK